MAPTMTSRTHQALRFLGLVDEGGNRLPAFERLKRAETREYPEQLAEIVREAYLPVFTIVDLSQPDDIKITDAFRRYEPSKQRDKMIALFRGLCEEAAILPRAKKRETPAATRGAETARRRPTPPVKVPPSPPDDGAAARGPDLSLVSAVVMQLPRDRKWTTDQREKWINALVATIDLLFEIDEEESGRSRLLPRRQR